jgi:hypothetical protein
MSNSYGYAMTARVEEMQKKLPAILRDKNAAKKEAFQKALQRALRSLVRGDLKQVIDLVPEQQPCYHPSYGADVALSFPHPKSKTDNASLDDNVRTMLGNYYHLVAHYWYTPPKMRVNYGATFYMLEDIRVETLSVAAHESLAPFYRQLFADYFTSHANFKPELAHLFTYGRRFLHPDLREAARAAFIIKDQNVVSAIEKSIDLYKTLNLTSMDDTRTAGLLVNRFNKLVAPYVQTQGAMLDFMHGNSDRPAETPGDKQSGDQAQQQDKDTTQAQNKVDEGRDKHENNNKAPKPSKPETSPKPEKKPKDSKKDKGDGSEEQTPGDDSAGEDAQDQTEPGEDDSSEGDPGDGGDDESDGEAGDQDGDDGDSSDEDGNDGGSAESSGGGEQAPVAPDGDSDGDSDGNGQDEAQETSQPSSGSSGSGNTKPRELTQGELNKAVRSGAKKAKADSYDLEQIEAEVESFRDEMDRAGAKAVVSDGYADLHGQAADQNMHDAAEAFRQILYAITAEDIEPGWEREQSSGRINMSRAMRGVDDYDTLFDRWTEGYTDDFAMSAALMVDMSSSMHGVANRETFRAAWVLRRGIELINGVCVTLAFNHDSYFVQDETPLGHAWVSPGASGGTAALSGIQKIEGWMKYQPPKNTKVAFILTDGEWADLDQCEKLMAEMTKKGVLFVIVGLGMVPRVRVPGTVIASIRNGADFAVVGEEIVRRTMANTAARLGI